MNQRLQKQNKKQHELALDAYIGKTHEASELLAKMSEFVDNHGNVDPEEVNWSKVNTLTSFIVKLKELSAFIGM